MADKEEHLQQSAKRLETEPHDVRNQSYEYANGLWKLLVRNVGELEARSIMHHVMGDKKPGRPKTDKDVAMTCFIYAYILRWGLRLTDAKIASHIHKSSPYYLLFESGAVAVANSDFTEAFMGLTDDPIVGREPIHSQLAAIKKRVERVRRSSILPKGYAPRAYYRD